MARLRVLPPVNLGCRVRPTQATRGSSIPAGGKTDAQLAAEIIAALNQGKMVVLDTYDTLPAHTLPTPAPVNNYEKNLVGNHAYPVLWAANGEFELGNVWAFRKFARLPESLLSELIQMIRIY